MGRREFQSKKKARRAKGKNLEPKGRLEGDLGQRGFSEKSRSESKERKRVEGIEKAWRDYGLGRRKNNQKKKEDSAEIFRRNQVDESALLLADFWVA